MSKQFSNLSLLLKHLSLLLLVYSIQRLLFYCFNYSYFSDLSIWKIFSIFIFGLRFDLSVIVLSNGLFILLYLLPVAFREKKWYGAILKFIFIGVNSTAMLANCVDFAFFKFTLKRTDASVFNFFGGKIGNDLGRLLPLFLKEYWYIVIIWIILSVFMYRQFTKIEKKIPEVWRVKDYLFQTIILIIFSAFSIVIYRGGLQLKPISIVSAGEYASVKYVPLIVSTPFTILKTIDVAAIEPSDAWKLKDDYTLRELYNPIHKGKSGRFKKLNVFVIALESFSKEYVGAINGKHEGCTPFLDSLISQSLTFTNAYANGKTSIEGIPAIVSSIPTWMNEPYITSPYGSNQMNSLANLLKQKGYYTAFFHGGTNGTMGFDAFANLAGYDNYYGRNEYHNEKDYDGNWGIWDEEFMQYAAQTINKKKQPFFATIFTLTSHHPFPVPNKYKGKFKEGLLPIEKSIEYSDFALKQFFETAKKMPWFYNTLFVLSADHTGISVDPFYTNIVGNYSIPIIYYMPNGQLKGLDSTITQQIDIMPSVLDYLNYPQSYFAFGNSVFNTNSKHFAFIYKNGISQLIENNYLLQFDGDIDRDLYNYRTDSLLRYDVFNKEPEITKQMENRTKAIIQTYQQSLINNKMH
jgi:phosphoglycerol transferase MdoB-like AlkP superfamily enzyme